MNFYANSVALTSKIYCFWRIVMTLSNCGNVETVETWKWKQVLDVFGVVCITDIWLMKYVSPGFEWRRWESVWDVHVFWQHRQDNRCRITEGETHCQADRAWQPDVRSFGRIHLHFYHFSILFFCVALNGIFYADVLLRNYSSTILLSSNAQMLFCGCQEGHAACSNYAVFCFWAPS